MGFLSPLLLALGAAVVIPVVLHLFQRHQGPRMVFPALRYLRRAEKESARRIRIRQILLLALRVSAVVLLALAAARPFVRSGGTAHEPTASVIILDNSLSTGLVVGDRRVLDDLKARALQIVAQAAPDDRFWVLRAGSPGEPAVPGDGAAAAQRIRETEVAGGGADLGDALARARALLANATSGPASRRAREIDLVSDLQATSFPGPVPAGRAAPPLVAWVPSHRVPPNAGVARVRVGGGLAPRAGERSTVQATLDGDRPDSVTVRLTIDSLAMAAAHATTGSTVLLPFPARQAGIATGWVEVDPDALRGDDRRYFAVTVEPPPQVALTAPATFVDAGLGVLADAGRVRRTDPAAAAILLAPAAAGTGAGAVGADRTVVVLPPDSSLELPAVNQRLVALGIPWRLAPPQGTGEARFQVRDTSDELERALADVRVRQTYPLQREPGATTGDTVLLRLDDGTPWAVRGPLPTGGRFILLASPLSPDASTLPTSSAMVPLLDRITGAWVSTAARRAGFAPGDVVPLPPGADRVRRADHTVESVAGDYRAPPITGIYRVLAGSREVAAFAVNPPASESDLTRLGARGLQALMPGWDLETASSPREWARDVFRHRLGHETWRPLVLLLLLVLLVEGWIATAGRSRGAGGAGRSRQWWLAALRRDPGNGHDRGGVVPGVAGPGGGGVG